MEAYRRRTKRIVSGFLRHQIEFPECVSALAEALVKAVPRLKPEELDDLRSLMLENNGIVMKEMHVRERQRKTNLKTRLKTKRKRQTPRPQI
jgi:hypothetical protein